VRKDLEGGVTQQVDVDRLPRHQLYLKGGLVSQQVKASDDREASGRGRWPPDRHWP